MGGLLTNTSVTAIHTGRSHRISHALAGGRKTIGAVGGANGYQKPLT